MKTFISVILSCVIVGLMPVSATPAGTYSGAAEEPSLLGNYSENPQQAAVDQNSSSKTATTHKTTTHRHTVHTVKTTTTTPGTPSSTPNASATTH